MINNFLTASHIINNPTLNKYLLFTLLFFVSCLSLSAQQTAEALNTNNKVRCATQISIEEAIRKNPGIVDRWRKEGEKQFSAYIQRQSLKRGPATIEETDIIIPIVFHLIDDSTKLSGISDRDIYEQLELLNKAYNGNKATDYINVIPKEIYNRLGRIPIKFVLARRSPTGALTSGIQRRVNKTPDRIKIKSYNTGGLDAWDTDKYLNVWAGSFSGDDDGLLGIATPPFYTSEGPQGVVISLFTFPYTSSTSRSYFPAYSEGGTLIHEIGHYFYLWHTFGDSYVCNNNDFRIQSGWPLPYGAGPEGDDTPEQKADEEGNGHYGNPSMNYSDGCASTSFGMMYGSFMNYFDDRAIFMFSNGMKNRVVGCIDSYRAGLRTSNGATPPVAVTDAYLVNSNPRGTPERRAYIDNNVPLKVTVRNSGSTTLNSLIVNVKLNSNPAVATSFNLNLAAGRDTTLRVGNITGPNGTHILTIYTSNPNNTVDAFTHNDTLQSFLFISDAVINAPFMEDFSASLFPPVGWRIWNPNNNATWERNNISGFTDAGSATVQNFSYSGGGQLDELIMPQINTGIADSSLLSFKVAYKVYSEKDVSLWDGLEIYISNDGGLHYDLAYKKTGNQLKTTTAAVTNSYTAPPSSPGNWRNETINLTPYLIPGKKLLIKFRNVNAHGNNLYLDDISVSAHVSVDRDVLPTSLTNVPEYVCEGTFKPTLTFRTDGALPLTSLKINYRIGNGNVESVNWTGTLTQNNSATVELPALTNQEPGEHTLTIFTSQPNGSPDLNVSNDTIRQVFYSMGQDKSPIVVDFEYVSFPPAEWVIANQDKGITWQRTTTTAASGIGSMSILNFRSNSTNTIDKFMSPVVGGNELYDSVFVSFDYAYAAGVSSGAGTKWDTLEVAVTTDCGKSFTTIWKKYGIELQTITGAGTPSEEYIAQAGDFKNIRIPLFPITGNKDFQVFFISRSNHHNNLYIDNINIFGKIVPVRLKQQGYLIYPSPFRDQFIIRNYEEPVTLKSAALFNSIGQRVWMQEYNGAAFKEIFVNAANLPKGIYTVKLFYTDKTVVEKIVKQ